MSHSRISSKIKDPQPIYLTVSKAVLLISTAACQLMVFLTGAGLIYNRASYGSEIARMGGAFIFSAVLMTTGAVLCCFRKSVANVISAVISAAGLVICLSMLAKLTDHADRSGWSDNYTMLPVSGMYRSRVLPVIFPALLTVVITAVQYFSYDLREERRLKRERRKAQENAPAPPIVEDDDE